MEQQPQNIKIILAIAAIVLVLGASFVLFGKYQIPDTESSATNGALIVMVENTPMVDGVLPVPAGFPQDIPLEKDMMLESATTQYPIEDTKQLFVSYQSPKTITQKYTEYKGYMTNAGYQVTEGDANSSDKTIFGTKGDTNLSIIISNPGEGTLVKLSYLLKSL